MRLFERKIKRIESENTDSQQFPSRDNQESYPAKDADGLSAGSLSFSSLLWNFRIRAKKIIGVRGKLVSTTLKPDFWPVLV
ncbi:hypothetical protein V1477_002043, partial [Vespula maculifrons]